MAAEMSPSQARFVLQEWNPALTPEMWLNLVPSIKHGFIEQVLNRRPSLALLRAFDAAAERMLSK